MLFTLISVLLLQITNANCQERINPAGEIPILAWFGIPAGETTLARYKEMKDAGITFQLTSFSNIDEMQLALDVAGKVGFFRLLPGS
jgi:hypothetical protein